jgi:hypothetical protein
MAEQDGLRLTGVVIKEALGRFAHGPIAAGFGKLGGGVLSQEVSTLHQARGAPDIAEFGLGKCADGPVGVIGEVPHAHLLYNRMAWGVAG